MARKKTPPWNGLSPWMLSVQVQVDWSAPETYGTHDRCLPVKLYTLSVHARSISHISAQPEMAGADILVHTRSSPIGPAEHDEGGSL